MRNSQRLHHRNSRNLRVPELEHSSNLGSTSRLRDRRWIIDRVRSSRVSPPPFYPTQDGFVEADDYYRYLGYYEYEKTQTTPATK